MLSLGSLADVLRGCLLVSLRSDILWNDDDFFIIQTNACYRKFAFYMIEVLLF